MKTLTYDHINDPFILRMGNYNITGLEHDYSKDYLTITALENFSLSFPAKGSYTRSLDDGVTWETVANNTSTNLTSGQKVLLKSDTPPSAFATSGRFNISGNIMSFPYGDDFANVTELDSFKLTNLFNNSSVVDASNLVLPSVININEGFSGMFYGCTLLTKAPKLEATTLTTSCYQNMFAGCTSLTTAPELPALTLAQACYQGMFNGCTSLNYIKMMATDISANSCLYNWMKGVATFGTLTVNRNANWNFSIIPIGWTIVDEDGNCLRIGEAV